MATQNALLGTTGMSTSLVAGSTIYGPLCGAGFGWGWSAEASAQQQLTGSGTFSNLYVNIATNTLSGSATINMRINGSNGNLSVSIPAAGTGNFSDAAHSDSASNNDLYCLAMTTAAGSGLIVQAGLSLQFDQTSQPVVPLLSTSTSGSTNGQISGNSITRYLALAGDTFADSVESDIQSFAMEAATISGLQVTVVSNTSASATAVGTRVNGVNGAQSISIPANGTGRFTDPSNSDTLAVGDKFNVYATTGASSTAVNIGTVAVNYVGGAYSRVPVYANDNTNTVSSGAVRYSGMFGAPFNSASNNTEASRYHPAPFSCMASALSVSVSSNASTVATTVVSRINGANGNQSISIPNAGTGRFTDPTHQDYLAAGDRFTSKASGSNGNVVVVTQGMLVSGPAAPIQLGGTTGTLSTTVLTTTGDSPAGALIVVTEAWFVTNGFPSAITDSAGNTYSTVTSFNSNPSIRVYQCPNANALPKGGTITLTYGSTTGARYVSAVSMAGVATATPLDKVGTWSSALTTTPSVSTGTLSQASEFVLGIDVINTGGADTYTEGAGFAPGLPVLGTSAVRTAWNVTSATTSVAYAPTLGTSRTNAIEVISFKMAGGGGSNYSVSLSESLSAADLLSSAAALLGPLLESATAGDAVLSTGTFSSTISETPSAADTLTTIGSFPSTIAEVGTGADAVSGSTSMPGSLSDAGSAGDQVAMSLNSAPPISEAVAAADVLTTTGSFPSSISETSSAAETLTGGLALAGALAESGSAADALSSSNAMTAPLTEAGSAADVLSTLAAFLGALAEAGSAADLVSSTASFPSSLADSGSASDALTGGLLLTASLSESGSAADSTAASVSVSGTVSESAAASEVISSLAAMLSSMAEAASSADTIATTAAYASSLSETSSAADALTGGLTFLASVSEAGSAGDAVSSVLAAACQVAESGTSIESVSAIMAFASPIGESASAADAVTSLATFNVSVADTAAAADVIQALLALQGSLSEAGSAVDAQSIQATFVASLAEAGVAAETISNAVAYTSALSEIGSARDAIRLLVQLRRIARLIRGLRWF